jgi:hypothetical protein
MKLCPAAALARQDEFSPSLLLLSSDYPVALRFDVLPRYKWAASCRTPFLLSIRTLSKHLGRSAKVNRELGLYERGVAERLIPAVFKIAAVSAAVGPNPTGPPRNLFHNRKVAARWSV